MTKRAPTIVDVAKAAGVSKSLVSLALRGDEGVKAQTRDRILQIAAEIGYRSNHLARSLVRGQSQVIGMLLNDLHSNYHTEIVAGVESAASAAGYGVILAHGQRDSEVLAERLAQLQSMGVDGVIVVSASLSVEQLSAAATIKPVVVVGRPATVPAGVGAVWNNDELGASLAVSHLAGLGHQRIAHLSGSTRPSSRARLSAFHSTMTKLALREPHQVFHDPAGIVQEIVRGRKNGTNHHPTAVFCSNDRRAAALVGVALDAGLHIPEDLSIVGYDNTELATLVRPTLSSVDQPRSEMGNRALQALVDLIAGEPARLEVLDPKLVARQSSAGLSASATTSPSDKRS